MVIIVDETEGEMTKMSIVVIKQLIEMVMIIPLTINQLMLSVMPIVQNTQPAQRLTVWNPILNVVGMK